MGIVSLAIVISKAVLSPPGIVFMRVCSSPRPLVSSAQLSKRELTRKLAAYGTCSSPVVVTVTEYGPLEGAYQYGSLPLAIIASRGVNRDV